MDPDSPYRQVIPGHGQLLMTRMTSAPGISTTQEHERARGRSILEPSRSRSYRFGVGIESYIHFSRGHSTQPPAGRSLVVRTHYGELCERRGVRRVSDGLGACQLHWGHDRGVSSKPVNTNPHAATVISPMASVLPGNSRTHGPSKRSRYLDRTTSRPSWVNVKRRRQMTHSYSEKSAREHGGL